MAGRKLLLRNAKGVKKKLSEDDMGELIQKLLRLGSHKFQRELMTLQGKDYVDRYLQMLEYSVPKLSRVEKSGGDDFQPVNIQFITSGSVESKMISPKEEVIDISAEEVE